MCARPLSLLLLGSLTGCKVIDAPDALEELVVFGFIHYEEDGYPEATAEKLVPEAASQLDALREGYLVDSLTSADLVSAGLPAADEEGEIIGVLGAVDYHHPLSDVVTFLSRHDKASDDEDTLVYDVEQETDRDCFLAGECDTLEQVIFETVEVAVLGEASRTYTQQYRWVEQKGGDPLVMIRSLTPEPMEFSSNLVSVSQQYAFILLIPSASGVRRVETFWVDAQFLGVDVPASYAVNNAVKTMNEQAGQVDAGLDALSL